MALWIQPKAESLERARILQFLEFYDLNNFLVLINDMFFSLSFGKVINQPTISSHNRLPTFIFLQTKTSIKKEKLKLKIISSQSQIWRQKSRLHWDFKNNIKLSANQIFVYFSQKKFWYSSFSPKFEGKKCNANLHLLWPRIGLGHNVSSGGWAERTKLREKVTLKFINIALPIVPTAFTIKLMKLGS